MAEKKKAKFLTYKGKPLVRCGNILYYGNMNEKCVVLIQLLSFKQVNDLKVADKVSVHLLATDPDVLPQDRILKKTEKKGLYQAMEIASVWLELALRES